MTHFNFETVKPSEHGLTNLDAMIDCETLGIAEGSPVITIGATLFDPFKCDSSEELMRRSTIIRIDIKDAVDNAAGVDGGTVRWWFEQSDEAIKALVEGDALPLKTALMELRKYCIERGTFLNDVFFDGISQLPPAGRFWAKDPDFDMILLRYFYDKFKIQTPWHFSECRSVRTVQDLAWPEGKHTRPSFEIPGVAHDARWDAIQQAMTVQAAMFRLGQSTDQDVKFDAWKGTGKQAE